MQHKNCFFGYDIGMLVMKSWVPKPPGHISCLTNYDFPVYCLPVEDTSTRNIHGGDESILPAIIDAAHQLERFGCKAIVTSCGYFGHFQRKVAENCQAAVYLSAVCMAPFIFSTMRKDQRLGIICYNRAKMTRTMLEACGLTTEMIERCVVRDIINEPELCNIIKDQGHYNIDIAREEVVGVVEKLCAEEKSIGAILLECTDLPPHAYAIQEAVNLPVFHATDMIKFVESLIER